RHTRSKRDWSSDVCSSDLENHNPIEMHATIPAWDGDRLTLWDKTQWVHNVADEVGAVFGIPAENVRVVSPFVGGAFGSGLRAWQIGRASCRERVSASGGAV